jgi:hypothetical protein
VLWAIIAAGLFLAWVIGTAASTSWLMVLRYFNYYPFNVADPIFGMDVSFYLFSLPFWNFVQTWLLISLLLSLIGAVAIYALAQQNNLAEGRLVILPHVQLHLSVLGALVFFVFALGHWLGRFELLYSDRGVAIGASYTDVNVSLYALWVMVAVATIAGLILLANIFFRRNALSLGVVFVWIVVGIVGTSVIPGVVQRYIVEPNELAAEAPYIEHNINFTNFAYGLDRIQDRNFPSVAPLPPAATNVPTNSGNTTLLPVL